MYCHEQFVAASTHSIDTNEMCKNPPRNMGVMIQNKAARTFFVAHMYMASRLVVRVKTLVKLATCWSQVRRPYNYTTKPPGSMWKRGKVEKRQHCRVVVINSQQRRMV